MPGHQGEAGGGIICDQILFRRNSKFRLVLAERHGNIMFAA